MKKAGILIALIVFTLTAFGQSNEKTAVVKGKTLSKETNEPASEAQVVVPTLKLITTTDESGNFNLSGVPYGTYQVIINGSTFKADTLNITIDKDEVDLGSVALSHNDKAVSAQSIQNPTITDETNPVQDEESIKTQNVSGLLTTSNDPFIHAVSFVLGAYHFQSRGYDRDRQDILVNNVPMNDIETGSASWNQWGGLNDVFHARSSSYGLSPSEYSFGGLNGTISFDATAAAQRKQVRVSYSLSNRQYTNRLMLTYSSGLMKNGWAYAFSASMREAKQSYIPGTFFTGYSYYAGVSKKIKKQLFSFTTFGAPTRRGGTSPATQEAYDLAGTNFYNPNWGYQTNTNGDEVMRNAKVYTSFQPTVILNHQYSPTERTKWNTALAYQFGKTSSSGLDWYNASDPRPDYYQYLPSWLSENGNAAGAEELKQQLMSDPSKTLQLDWDKMYNANYINTETISDVDGIAGNNVTGHRSLYVIGKSVTDLKKWAFNTNIQHSIHEHIVLYTGLTYVNQSTESYRQLDDLLGGSFFVNYNQFAARQYVGSTTLNQNNLADPNQVIYVGDKYDYDYTNHFNKGLWWGQATFTYNNLDFFAAANVGFNSFYRNGAYQNGLFPTASLGKSAVETFTTTAVKGGATYKLNGRNYFFLNGEYSREAPEIDNTFISPRTRDYTVTDPATQKNQSLEGGYLFKAPRVNARVSGYVTDVIDATKIKRFYNDDPAFQTYVNYVLQNINTRFTGTELAIDVKVNARLNVTGVASIGQAFYTNRPKVSVYEDNDTMGISTPQQVYLKNYYLAVGPQSAYTLGLNYKSKKYWYANINFNFLDRNYVDVNPERLTSQTVDLIEPGSAAWNAILGQEKLPAAFTVDLFAGKSFSLHKIDSKIPFGSFIYLNAGINNVLNNKSDITGGFEQLRYDFTDNDPGRFPSKYFYGLGRTYYVNISFKF